MHHEQPLVQPVTVGTAEDVDQVMALALGACDENAFLSPNPTKILANVWSALNLDAGVCGVIKNGQGLVEGAVLLRIGDMWYSDSQVVEEKGIYVHPDFRSAKGGRARMLCEFSKSVSDSLGIPLIIGVLSNARTEAKMRLYKRIFGEPAGGFFLYGAKTGSVSRTEH